MIHHVYIGTLILYYHKKSQLAREIFGEDFHIIKSYKMLLSFYLFLISNYKFYR